MSKQLFRDLDLKGNQLRDARAENFETPPAAGKPGRIIYNSTSGQLQVDNGTSFVGGTGGGGGALPTGGTAGQVLTKQSATDGDADWESIVLSGGNA